MYDGVQWRMQELTDGRVRSCGEVRLFVMSVE